MQRLIKQTVRGRAVELPSPHPDVTLLTRHIFSNLETLQMQPFVFLRSIYYLSVINMIDKIISHWLNI